jgi:hypothetical protein
VAAGARARAAMETGLVEQEMGTEMQVMDTAARAAAAMVGGQLEVANMVVEMVAVAAVGVGAA